MSKLTSLRSSKPVVGLTGGIGSGKSTCSRFAAEQGFPVFDCDAACDRAFRSEPFQLRLQSEFGDAGNVPFDLCNILALAGQSFRSRVSPLLGSFVKLEANRFIKESSFTSSILIDAPLLFEWELDDLCDEIICLSAPVQTRLARVLARESPAITAPDFWEIAGLQLDDADRSTCSMHVIHTDCDQAEMTRRFLSVLAKTGFRVT